MRAPRLDPSTAGVAKHILRAGSISLSDILLRAESAAAAAEAVKVLSADDLVSLGGVRAGEAPQILEQVIQASSAEELNDVVLAADDIQVQPMKALMASDLSGQFDLTGSDLGSERHFKKLIRWLLDYAGSFRHLERGLARVSEK